MQITMKRPVGLFAALLASLTVAFTGGCVSGGFKMTRSYASFVNRQMIIVRVLLYIFTSIVFAVTMLIDVVFYNTMDFWEGRVSAGEYNFNQGEKTFHVKHEVVPGGPLRRSTIEVFNKEKTLVQTVVFQETPEGQVELLVDGVVRARAHDLSGLPMVAQYDAQGKMTADQVALVGIPVPLIASTAR